MRVLISSVGTRGDVQPAIALALQLRKRGAGVRLCVPPNFIWWAAALGFEATALGIEMRAPRPGEPTRAIPDLITDQFDTLTAAGADCDVVVGAGVHQYAARSVAEVLCVPSVVAAYAPTSLPPMLNDQERAQWNARSLERVNANRARLGLPAVDDVLGYILADEPWLAADPVLAPASSQHLVQTGAWLLNDPTPLPAEVESFIEDGEPPIYIGIGSMPAAPSTGALLVNVARALGRRAILSAGWAGLEADGQSGDGLLVDELNHQALFRKVAAVVHHGGAGTTATAAQAGSPQVITPMFSDQFYWGDRVEALGLGSKATLDGAGLTVALERALAPGVAARAKALASEVVGDGADLAARRVMERVQ